MASSYRTSLKFIIAIIVVSLIGYGVYISIDLGSCGSMDVYDKFVVIHTSCKFKVSNADIPSIKTEDGILYIQLPQGWQWRVIP